MAVPKAMLQPVSWGLNTALGVLCCFLLARIGVTLADELLYAPPDLGAPDDATASAPAATGGDDPQVIVSRNLFDADFLAPVKPAPPPEEPIEATELPLGLLGTAVTPGPEPGWAAIWNLESRESQVVTAGDELGDGEATVVRIERERVVLSENGDLRELVPDEDLHYRPKRSAASIRKARARRERHRRRTRR
jgi:hypothetical protein